MDAKHIERRKLLTSNDEEMIRAVAEYLLGEFYIASDFHLSVRENEAAVKQDDAGLGKYIIEIDANAYEYPETMRKLDAAETDFRRGWYAHIKYIETKAAKAAQAETIKTTESITTLEANHG